MFFYYVCNCFLITFSEHIPVIYITNVYKLFLEECASLEQLNRLYFLLLWIMFFSHCLYIVMYLDIREWMKQMRP